VRAAGPVAGLAAVALRADLITVIEADGRAPEGAPVGLTFLGRAWSEPALIRLAHAFERATNYRRPPTSVAG